MSSIEHRRRLRERREAAQSGNLAGFTGSTRQTTHAPNTVVQNLGSPNDGEPVEQLPDGEVATHEGERQPDQVVDTPQAQTGTPAIQPEGRQAMTPQQMREQAVVTAQTLAQLDADQYQQALADLETQNPTFYAVVCDELNNLAAATSEEEGDGFDLSGIAGGGDETPATQEAAESLDQQPEHQDGAEEFHEGDDQTNV